jgi:dihydrolipoamide dehydrogenase
MVVGELAEPVDVLVVGGGPGGYAAAVRAAQLGRAVTLVERGGNAGLGGCCLHVGCIPSKALIELAEGRHRLGTHRTFGLEVGETTVDMARFQEAKGTLVANLARGVAGLMAAHGVSVLHGEARLSRADRAAVQTTDGNMTYLEFRDAVIATGSRAAELPGLPFDDSRVIDSTGLLALDQLPSRLLVVGAGVIGIELGMALAKLGTRVTLVEARERILPEFDAVLSEPVTRRLRELEIEVLLNSQVLGLEDQELVVHSSAGERRLPADHVLVAIGRRPNSDGLGLELAGIEIDERGIIDVGADLRATPHIAAIGDLVAGPALAHKAIHQGQVAAESLCGQPAAFAPLGIPQIVFSDPEIATVGLSEGDARAAGLDVAIASFPFSASGRALTMGVDRGFTRLIADRATDRIVGVQIVGPHASELIAEGTLAVEMIASPADLAETIHAHPTLSESLGEAALLLDGRPLHLRPASKQSKSGRANNRASLAAEAHA